MWYNERNEGNTCVGKTKTKRMLAQSNVKI